MKHPAEPQTIWFFSDEKNFCLDQRRNTQNSRWLAYSPKDTRSVMQTKFSQTVMVFGCVSCEGDDSHFFRQGLRLNSDEYMVLLVTVVKPWITRVANGRQSVWQQDYAPCHTSGKSQKWLLANFCHYTSPSVWPTISPDLSPMDYYVWEAVVKDANRRASTTKAQLINIIKAVFVTLPRESVTSSCSRFRGWIVAVVNADVGYFQ